MTDIMAWLFVVVHPSKAKLTLFRIGNRFLIAYSLRQMFLRVIARVSNCSGLPGCGLGLEQDRMVQSGLLPGKQGYPRWLGTGWNRTTVLFYCLYNFRSNSVCEF